jgi:hypothetical protein
MCSRLQSSVSRLGLYASARWPCDLGRSNVCTDLGRSDPMRVAVIVVLLVATTPAEASKSCMTKTEARQHFGSVHIYWHGEDHCWDATPMRRHHQIHKVQQKIDEPKWHQAMSEMLLDEEPVQTPWVDRWVDIEPAQLPIVARRAEIVQVRPPPIIEPEPMVTPRHVVMVIIAITLTLATVEVLFGGSIYRRPTSRRRKRFSQ